MQRGTPSVKYLKLLFITKPDPSVCQDFGTEPEEVELGRVVRSSLKAGFHTAFRNPNKYDTSGQESKGKLVHGNTGRVTLITPLGPVTLLLCEPQCPNQTFSVSHHDCHCCVFTEVRPLHVSDSLVS